MPSANNKPQFQERHQDYVFTAPVLQPGVLQAALAFQLDSDFPFELRGMAARVPYDPTPGPTFGTQAGLQLVAMRWSGPNQDYRQQSPVPLNLLLGPYFGQVGNPRPVYPPTRYAKSDVIYIDLLNNGPNAITGLQVFFRGVKLLPAGSSPYTYPQTLQRAPLPFLYPSGASGQGVNAPLPLLTLPVTASLPNQQFAPDNDSDFAFRFGQAGPQTGTWEVFITLKDESWKPYSNAPVHADVLFGRSGFPAAFPCGPASFVAPVGPGASQPGLLVPEIYIPRNHKIWFDISRNDSAYAGAAQVTYPLTFGGEKVF